MRPAELKLRPEWMRLVTLGMNPLAVGILCALAESGGSANTLELRRATGAAANTMNIRLRHLEDEGYIVGDPPPADRRPGHHVVWVLRVDALHKALDRLKSATTPRT